MTDIDGCWTDGSVLFHAEGDPSVRFAVHDGYGITLLLRSGIEVAVVSGRDCPAVRKRLDHLGVTERHMGNLEKGAAALKIVTARGLNPEQVAAFGDDLPDLDLFKHAGLRLAPPGSRPEILAAADHVTRLPGGSGALREICGLLLEARGVDP